MGLLHYPKTTFEIRHVVGIDTSDPWVDRTGVRRANDLVWVGPAANYAAQLTERNTNYPTWITHRVYDAMNLNAKEPAQWLRHHRTGSPCQDSYVAAEATASRVSDTDCAAKSGNAAAT